MKKILLILFFIPILIMSQNTIEMTNGKFVDKRDGKSYKWVKIGNQIWMSENLNFESTGYKKFKDGMGGLYDYESLNIKNDSNGICPDGWHIPSVNDWNTLFSFIGKVQAGQKLKSTKFKGDDSYNFNVLPNGRYYTEDLTKDKNTDYQNNDTHAYFWSSSQRDQFSYWGFFFYLDVSTVSKIDVDKNTGMSIRCIKN